MRYNNNNNKYNQMRKYELKENIMEIRERSFDVCVRMYIHEHVIIIKIVFDFIIIIF